jgi:hypothetical protein
MAWDPETIVSVKDGTEDADPTIKAFSEVVQPLARGYSLLFGGRDKSDRWYRKIFRELTLFRKEDSTYSKAAKKSLKNIEDKPSVIGDDGGKSFLGGLMGSILPWLLTAIAGLGPMILTGIRTVFGGFGLILRTVLAGVFSPIGLAIGAAAAVAWGLFTENGRKFFTDLGGKISDSWNSAVDWFKESFPGITEKFNEVADALSETFKPIADFLKEKFGVVSNAVSKGVETAKTAASDVAKYTSENVVKPVNNVVKKGAKGGFDLLKAAIGFSGGSSITGLTDAQTKALAAETQRTESGGDPRAENKYGYIGKYQFGADALADSYLVNSEKMKAARKAMSREEWYKRGQAEFLKNNDNWRIEGGKEAYLSNPELQDKAFVELSNINIKRGIRAGAISKNDSAEKIAAYVKAAHLKGYGGANELFLNNRDSRDANGTSASKYANDGSAAVRDLAPQVEALINATAQINQAQSVYSPSPRIPKAPAPVAIQESPGVTMPLSSGDKDRPIFVSLPVNDVGQDLSDRRIGLLATGGLSGKY